MSMDPSCDVEHDGSVSGVKRARGDDVEAPVGSDDKRARLDAVADPDVEENDDAVVDTSAGASEVTVADELDDVDDAFVRRPGKRGRRKLTLAEVSRRFPWVKLGAAAEEVFNSKDRSVICTICDGQLKAGATVSNLKPHETSKAHLRAAAMKSGQTTIALVDPAAVPEHMHKLRENVRSTATATAMCLVPKSQIEKLFGGDLLTAANFLRRNNILWGAAGTVGRDVEKELTHHKKDIASLVEGNFGALVVDGASLPTFFEGTVKPVAVMFSCSLIGKPLALGYVKNETGTADDAAVEVKTLLGTYGIPMDHITCLVGDNVAWNDVLADELNVVRMKCVSHSLALLLKAITGHFPVWEVMTVTLGALLHAGGGNKRRIAMATAGVRPSAITGYANRWGSTTSVAKKLLEAKPVGAEEGGPFPITVVQEQVEAWSPSTTDCNEYGKSRLAIVQAAFREDNIYSNVLQLAVVLQLAGEVDDLITAAGADSGKVDPALPVRLDTIKTKLEAVAADETIARNMMIQDAVNKSPLDHDADEVAAQAHEMRSKLKAAAVDALTVFKKHVTPALRVVKYRFLYDQKVKPPPLPKVEGDTNAIARQMRAFLGFDTDTSFVDMTVEYEKYCKAWPSLSAKDKALPMAQFWHGHKGDWPTLSKVARWWAEVPTSSVAAERMFAIMRSFALPHRATMGGTSFEAEWLFRANSELVEARLHKALVKARAK